MGFFDELESGFQQSQRQTVGAVDWVTNLPNRLHYQADRFNERLIGYANEFRNKSYGVARENLGRGRVKSYSNSWIDWIFRNKWKAGIVALIAFILIRRL